MVLAAGIYFQGTAPKEVHGHVQLPLPTSPTRSFAGYSRPALQTGPLHRHQASSGQGDQPGRVPKV